MAKQKYFVCDGGSLHTKRDLLEPGDEVRPGDIGGEEQATLDSLEERGVIEKATESPRAAREAEERKTAIDALTEAGTKALDGGKAAKVAKATETAKAAKGAVGGAKRAE